MSAHKANASAVPADILGALLTSKELAKQLKVKEEYVNWLRRRHGLPHVRVGGQARFNLNDVNAWLAERTVSTKVTGGRS